jgi:hypothetical protein
MPRADCPGVGKASNPGLNDRGCFFPLLVVGEGGRRSGTERRCLFTPMSEGYRPRSPGEYYQRTASASTSGWPHWDARTATEGAAGSGQGSALALALALATAAGCLLPRRRR